MSISPIFINSYIGVHWFVYPALLEEGFIYPALLEEGFLPSVAGGGIYIPSVAGGESFVYPALLDARGHSLSHLNHSLSRLNHSLSRLVTVLIVSSHHSLVFPPVPSLPKAF